MLCVRFENGTNTNIQRAQLKCMTVDSLHSVKHVTADGVDLQTILLRFPSLPKPVEVRELVTWFGDDARFILANL